MPFAIREANDFPRAFNRWAKLRNKAGGRVIDVQEYDLWLKLKKEWGPFEKEQSRYYRQ